MEKEKAREAINAFYESAGMQGRFTGEVNERLAEVFGRMLNETRR